MTPEEYIIIKENANKAITVLKEQILNALTMAKQCSIPKNLYQAMGNDIFIGNVIWYPEYNDWHIVEEILHSEDRYKAYIAEDGCRYGLEGAFIVDKNIDMFIKMEKDELVRLLVVIKGNLDNAEDARDFCIWLTNKFDLLSNSSFNLISLDE